MKQKTSISLSILKSLTLTLLIVVVGNTCVGQINSDIDTSASVSVWTSEDYILCLNKNPSEDCESDNQVLMLLIDTGKRYVRFVDSHMGYAPTKLSLQPVSSNKYRVLGERVQPVRDLDDIDGMSGFDYITLMGYLTFYQDYIVHELDSFIDVFYKNDTLRYSEPMSKHMFYKAPLNVSVNTESKNWYNALITEVNQHLFVKGFVEKPGKISSDLSYVLSSEVETGSFEKNGKDTLDQRRKATLDYDMVRINMGRSYNSKPKTKNFVTINFKDSTITYSKRIHSRKKLLDWDTSYNFLLDSSIHNTVQLIAQSNATSNPICQYHIEKGYYTIQWIKTTYKQIPLYSESYIIHRPYHCTDETLGKTTLRILTSYRQLLESR